MSADRVAALAEVIWAHTGEVCGVDCAEGFGYHDVESEEERKRGCRHIAKALLDSPAMRDLLAEVWDEGHAIGALDAANRVIWNHPPTPNPHREVKP